MRKLRGIVSGLIGFAIGLVLAIALEMLLVYAVGAIFNSRMVPRGLGWVVLPIMSGVLGFGLFYNLATDPSARAKLVGPLGIFAGLFKPGNVFNRICLGAAVAYVVVGHLIRADMGGTTVEGLYQYQGYTDDLIKYVWLPAGAILLVPLLVAWARKPPKVDP